MIRRFGRVAGFVLSSALLLACSDDDATSLAELDGRWVLQRGTIEVLGCSDAGPDVYSWCATLEIDMSDVRDGVHICGDRVSVYVADRGQGYSEGRVSRPYTPYGEVVLGSRDSIRGVFSIQGDQLVFEASEASWSHFEGGIVMGGSCDIRGEWRGERLN